MSVVPVLLLAVVAVLLTVLLAMLLLPVLLLPLLLTMLAMLLVAAFLRAGGGGRGGLDWAVLPGSFLLSPGEEGASPTEVVGGVSTVTADLGEGLFLLDLELNLVLNLALLGVGVESVVSVQEGHVAQRDVLAAPAVSNLLSVKVSAHTDCLVPIVVVSEDDDLGAIESNVVLGSEDLDSATWVGLDAGNVVVALGALTLLADGEWERDGLAVNHGGDVTSWLDLGETGTWNAALGGEDDLGLGEDQLQLHAVGSKVLGQDSHGVLTGAIGGQKMVAALSNAGFELSVDIVKGGDGLSFQLARWLSIRSEEVVLDVLVHGLGGREWESGLDESVAWDVLDLELSLVGQDPGPPVFGIWGQTEGDDGRVAVGWALWEAVVVDVFHVVSLQVVAGGVEELLETLWEILGPLEGQASLVEGRSLLGCNNDAVIGHGETLVLLLLALTGLRRLGASPFSHVWSTLELTGHADLVLFQIFVLASASELEKSLGLNAQFVVEESLAKSNQQPWVSPLGVDDLGAEFRAEFGLLTLIVGLDDGLGEFLDRVGVGWETAGSFLGGGTLGITQEEFVLTLGQLEDELLLVGVLLLEKVDWAGGVVHWRNFLLLGDKSKDDETAPLENFLGVLVGVGSLVGLRR